MAERAWPQPNLIQMVYSRFFLLSAGLVLLFALPQSAQAGGPHEIAGTAYFESTLKGVPLSWARGTISYYTDQGNLSPILPETSADAFVADAFSRWTSISTAAVSAQRAGRLGEDVNGTNVSSSGGVIRLPVDILPSPAPLPAAMF